MCDDRVRGGALTRPVTIVTTRPVRRPQSENQIFGDDSNYSNSDYSNNQIFGDKEIFEGNEDKEIIFGDKQIFEKEEKEENEVGGDVSDVSDVIKLISDKRYDEVEEWLNSVNPCDVPKEDTEGLSLLMLCAGDVRMLEVLLEAGVDPTYRTKQHGETLLTYTVLYYTVPTIRLVTEICVEKHPAAINIPNKGGFTPLQLLLVYNYTQLFDRFVELGADPAIPNTLSGESPIHQAMRRGQTTVVQSLISLRVPLTPIKKTGETPVHIGAWCRQTFLTYQILKYGANCRTRSKSGTTALHWAAQRGDKDMIVLLLVAGADPAQRDHFGMNSMMVAEKRCGEDVLSVFNTYSTRLLQPLSLQYLARRTYLWKCCKSRDLPSATHSAVYKSRDLPSATHSAVYASRDLPSATHSAVYVSRDLPSATHSAVYTSRVSCAACGDVECRGERCALPQEIQDYLNATDYQLLVNNMM